MNLLEVERSLPTKTLGKRILEGGSCLSHKYSPKFKRSNIDSFQSFPGHCGKFGYEVKIENLDFLATETIKTSNEIHDMAIVVPKPLRSLDYVKNRCIKPNVAYDGKLEVRREKINIKIEKFQSPKASRKLDCDVMLPKAGGDTFDLKATSYPLASEYQKSKLPNSSKAPVELNWDDVSLEKSIDNLSSLRTSVHSTELVTKYQDLKIPKSPPIIFKKIHNFLGSGKDYSSHSKVGADLATKRPSFETKPSKMNIETNDKSIPDEDEDYFIIEEKPTNVPQWNEDKLVSHLVTKKYPSQHVQGQASTRCKIDGEQNDEEICILSPLEWKKFLQSGLKCQNKTEKFSKAEISVGKMVCSKKGKVKIFAEEKVEETKAKQFKNIRLGPCDVATEMVTSNNMQKARNLYNELYQSLLHEYKEELDGGPIKKQIHVNAAMILKRERRWINMEPSLGHVPGVKIGDMFQFRAELAVVGLHNELNSGINYVTIDMKEYAISVVDAGRYDNRVESSDILVYSGHGGNSRVQSKKFEDQKLEKGNLALKNSMDAKLPVRVIRKTMLASSDAIPSSKKKKKIYIYDGLYTVSRVWRERSGNGKYVLMFELARMPGQPYCDKLMTNKQRRSMDYLEHNWVMTGDDVSQGQEKMPIKVVNEISDDTLAPFTYVTKMKYPHWHDLSVPKGCNCIGGCSDSQQCPCVVKNKGELPFNEEGAIVECKNMVYECGPNCKCPSSCQNRVSQHGPRLTLEVFRTKSRGWGVRSREDIPSGSFICEYIGELLLDQEADQRSNDGYLFDLDDGEGFTIDAAQYGNLGRFINHSCSPNLFAQNVLFDHDDKKSPHIMFFASEDIPALQELTFDYNCGRVCDPNGNIKAKQCCCGSRKCTGWMY
ncbi:hypothetical protein ACH5RR_016948 [Cinchona calisaya]|uniref:Uncharacterized protein n=1 Tax=Cinchona calisaya TaxID=153742 RepID=A0ABD2ZXF4_9GENT